MRKIILPLILLCIFTPTRAQNSDQADSYFQKQEWQQAAEAYRKLARAEPGNFKNWYRLGVSLHSQNKFDEAIAAYREAENISHGPIVMYNLACSYARKGDRENAFVWLEKSIDNNFPQLRKIASDEDLVGLRGEAKYQALTAKIEKKLNPCAYRPESRQFDFWAGDWIVKNPQGQQVGTNSVQVMLGSCMLLENWTDAFGNSGKSINFFNPQKGKWQQTWVDDKGNVIEFINGEFNDGRMRFYSEKIGSDGQAMPTRLSFYRIDQNTVRQHSEFSNDQGHTWTTQYDLTYFRKKVESGK